MVDTNEFTIVDDEDIDIDSDYRALESDFFILSMNSDDFGGFLGSAMESSETSVGQAQFKNFLNKVMAFIRRVVEAIPKMFAKLGRMIKHSKISTQIMLRTGVPKDLKTLSSDKLSVIKQLRLEILRTKMQLVDLNEKKIDKANYLSEEIHNEIQAILRVVQVSKNARKEVIAGKFDVAESKIRKLRDEYDRLKNIDISSTKEKLEELLERLKKVCNNDRLYALSVPAYNGNDKHSEYESKITRNIKECKSIAGTLDDLVRNNTSFSEAFNKTLASGLRKVENIGQAKKYTRNPDGTISYGNKDDDGEKDWKADKFRFSNIPGKAAAKSELDRGAKILTSGILKITQLFAEAERDLLKTVQDYCESSALVYKQPPMPKASDGETEVQADTTGPKADFYKGHLAWSNKEGCWKYIRECIDTQGNYRKISVKLTDERDKNTKPKPSQATVKKLNDEIKKHKDFKQFKYEEEDD